MDHRPRVSRARRMALAFHPRRIARDSIWRARVFLFERPSAGSALARCRRARLDRTENPAGEAFHTASDADSRRVALAHRLASGAGEFLAVLRGLRILFLVSDDAE